MPLYNNPAEAYYELLRIIQILWIPRSRHGPERFQTGGAHGGFRCLIPTNSNQGGRMEPLVKLFLEEHGKYVFGPGRAELLRAVDTLGSLNKAALDQGMSYRWAWGRIREAEKALGVTLLMPGPGSGKGNTKILTPEAREILQWFTALEKDMQCIAEEAGRKMPSCLFPKLKTAPLKIRERAG